MCIPPNPTTKSWSAWFDSVLYHASRFERYADFISNELKLSNQPSDSLLRLSQIYSDECHMQKLKTQFDFIKAKGPTLLCYLNYFRMRVPHVMEAHDKMQYFLLYLQQNTTIKSEDLGDSFLLLDKASQEYVKNVCETAFTKSDAKLRKYVNDAAQFLKEVKVLDPRKIMSSKLYSSYNNIPGFCERVSEEEWIKYVTIIGPEAVLTSVNGNLDLKQFWRSRANELPCLYKLASIYCIGTLGSYDVERAFSAYESILDTNSQGAPLSQLELKMQNFHQ